LSLEVTVVADHVFLFARAAWRRATARHVLNNPFVLGGVILLLVVVLLWGLYRAGRRIDRLSEEPGDVTQ
jgi:hypothetical protein